MRRFVVIAAVAAAGSWGCNGDGSMAGAGMMGASAAGESMMNGPAGGSMTAVSPAPGTQGVSVGASIDIQFTAAMPSSMPIQVDLHMGDLSGPVVPMSCSPSGSRTRLTCRPLEPLRPGTTYVTHVGAGMFPGGSACGSVPSMMGGQWVGGGMMSPTHGGMNWNGMGTWADACGGYGMAFPFTTA